MALTKLVPQPDPDSYAWNDVQLEVPNGSVVDESADGVLVIFPGTSQEVRIKSVSCSATGTVNPERRWKTAVPPVVSPVAVENGKRSTLSQPKQENPALVPVGNRRIFLNKRRGSSITRTLRRAKSRMLAHPTLRSRILQLLLEYGEPLTAPDITALLGDGSWSALSKRRSTDIVYEALFILRYDGVISTVCKNHAWHFYIYRPDLFHTLKEGQPKTLGQRNTQKELGFQTRDLTQRKARPKRRAQSSIPDLRPIKRKNDRPFEQKVDIGRRSDMQFPTLRKAILGVMSDHDSRHLSGADIARLLPHGPWSVYTKPKVAGHVRALLDLMAHEGKTKMYRPQRDAFDGSIGNPVYHKINTG
jgi:Fe2+ or Zn2+ uptake regulation protein